MSIVIQGIDIPKRHYIEGFYIDEDGNILNINRKHIIGKATKLPPHGRLIDADKLMKKIKDVEYKCIMTGKMYVNFFLNNAGISCVEWGCVEDLIKNAPTVLEAEAEE